MADPILYWNDVALEANRIDFPGPAPEQGGPTLSARALAIVHLAMYDAFVEDNSGNPDFSQNVGGVPLGIAIAGDIFANGLLAANGAPPLPQRGVRRPGRGRRTGGRFGNPPAGPAPPAPDSGERAVLGPIGSRGAQVEGRTAPRARASPRRRPVVPDDLRERGGRGAGGELDARTAGAGIGLLPSGGEGIALTRVIAGASDDGMAVPGGHWALPRSRSPLREQTA